MVSESPDLSEGRYDVLSPVGDQFTQEFRSAESLTDLSGKRVAFLWDLLFKGDFVFDVISEQLAGRHEGMAFVGHEVFGDIHGADEHAVLANLPELFRTHRIDAVVVGVGA
jgi:hypothetical protein